MPIPHTTTYSSPLGTITLACDDEALLGLWFEGQRHFEKLYDKKLEENYIKNSRAILEVDLQKHLDGCPSLGQKICGEDTSQNEYDSITRQEPHPILSESIRWLDIYFSGKRPDFLPPMKYDSTSFGKRVCDIMLAIPYGQTMTYGQIAVRMARAMGVERMSAQAVGRAVGRNPIAIMIPCHRVVGAHGNLTGYAGGIERKITLLEIEGVDMKGFFVPSRSRK